MFSCRTNDEKLLILKCVDSSDTSAEIFLIRKESPAGDHSMISELDLS